MEGSQANRRNEKQRRCLHDLRNLRPPLLHLEQEPLDFLHGLVEHGQQLAHHVLGDADWGGEAGCVLVFPGGEHLLQEEGVCHAHGIVGRAVVDWESVAGHFVHDLAAAQELLRAVSGGKVDDGHAKVVA